MHELLNILAQERGDGFELLWIIAVLVFSALGGLSEWIKNRRAKDKMERPTPRSRKPAAPPRRPASGAPRPARPSDSRTPTPTRPAVSRPQAPPQRPMPGQQRAPRPQPARKAASPAQPHRPSSPPLPQRDMPARRPGPGQLPPAVAAQRRREATGKPSDTPPKKMEQPPDAQPVRTSEMARQEVADRRPNIARELIFKPGQPLGRTDWRRAVIMNELFGRPVSLRSDEYLWDR